MYWFMILLHAYQLEIANRIWFIHARWINIAHQMIAPVLLIDTPIDDVEKNEHQRENKSEKDYSLK